MKLTKQRLKEIIKEELLGESLKRFKVFVSGESEPLILMGKDIKDVKQTAYAMIQNSSVRVKKIVREGKLDEGRPFRDWQDHSKNLDKLYRSAHWAMKAIPHKKKEVKEIQKLTQKLKNFVEIVVGQVVDM